MAVGNVTSNKVGSGARFNDGKVPYELIPTHLLESTARVLGYGAQKYAPWNWAKGMKYSVVIGCLKRHLAAIERGEDLDPETQQRHTGHLICNLLFLEHYMNQYPELDDRPKEWFSSPGKADGQEWFNKNEEEKYIDERKDCSQACQEDPNPLVERRIPNVRANLQPSEIRWIDGSMAGYDQSYFNCI